MQWAKSDRTRVFLISRMFSGSPQVCGRTLDALQINDDPMLNFGAATVISLASSQNAVSQLAPEAYGKYLWSSEFEPLLENSSFELRNKPIELSESQCVQAVLVHTRTSVVEYNLHLCKESRQEGDCWMIDAISKAH